MGDQVREETRCAKFGTDQCTKVFGGYMAMFRPLFLLIYAFFPLKQPTGQTA